MTKQECQIVLAIVNAKIEKQGRIVDDRLLTKKRDLEKLLADYE